MNAGDAVIGHALRDSSLIPYLLELGLTADLYASDKDRLIIEAVISLGEATNLVTVCERLSGKVDEAYITGKLEGLPHSDKENLPDHVRALQREKLAKWAGRVFSQSWKGNKFIPGRLDFETLGQVVDEERALRAPTEDEGVETAEELTLKDVIEIDRLIDPIVERGGYTLIGGMKGVGKSLIATQMLASFAAGHSTLWNEHIRIAKPGRALLVQQEVSPAGMQDRLLKMTRERAYNFGGRLFIKTTTGQPLKLTRRKDLDRLRRLIEKTEPDMVCLDCLYTFSDVELNNQKASGDIMDIVLGIKAEYPIALVIVHHGSNKKTDADINMVSSVGKFMNSSVIANAADNTIYFEYLSPRYRQNLPKNFNFYLEVEATCRHGRWPDKFYIERDEDGLLFRESSIMKDIGMRIIPDELVELVRAHDGEMRLKELIEWFKDQAHFNTVRRAVDECITSGRLKKRRLAEKGGPMAVYIPEQV